MNKKYTIAAVFLATQIFSAVIAWLGGYNFDQRNFWVAFYAFFSIAVGFMFAVATADLITKD